jgi:plasmid maintenance system antidote protein VapI
MAIRLGKFFGTSAEFWMNLQAAYELVTAKKILGNKITKIKSMTGAA